MGPPPEKPAAGLALKKPVKIQPGLGFQQVKNLVLGPGQKQGIAGRASGEKSGFLLQTEKMNDFRKLVIGQVGPDPPGKNNFLAL